MPDRRNYGYKELESGAALVTTTPSTVTENGASSLIEVLQRWARASPNARAFRYLRENQPDEALCYGELDEKARQIAGVIKRHARAGDRVLLMFPPGLEFISAFFGCLYAGSVAVPTACPNSKRGLPRVLAIAEDCRPTVALTLSGTLASFNLARVPRQLQSLEWIAVDEIRENSPAEWVCPSVQSDTLAFLQYTSGSTSEPKGVMVSHGNAIYNLEMIRMGFGLASSRPGKPAGVGVSWLPAYHDMGLVGGILESLYIGGSSVLMSPASFLQRPERWLQAIATHGASVSGAPNFAYELCVRRAGEVRLGNLDLSSWRVAYCGAEPIRAETLERFAKTFAPYGFRNEALYPCYGLAEATLLSAGGPHSSAWKTYRVRRSNLLRHEVAEANGEPNDRVATLVGCGSGLLAQEVVIADPGSMSRRDAGQVGEIWLKGPNVAQGYWGRPRESEETFAARLADTGEEPFLRTGDLGFVRGGNLFVTGRAKDLIVVRGRNHYPQDIESTAQQAHPALLPNSGAAFAVEEDGQPQLIIVQEVDRKHRNADFEAIARTVRGAVARHHELDLHAIAFIRQASIPRTTSGKVQRSLCRQRYANDELTLLAKWTRPAPNPKLPEDVGGSDMGCRTSLKVSASGSASRGRLGRHREIDQLADRIEGLLLKWLGQQGVAPAEIEPDKVFADYGVDSVAAVGLSLRLEEWLNIEIDPVIAWQFPTPASLARHLAGKAGEGLDGDEDDDSQERRNSADDDFAELIAEIEELSESEARTSLERKATTK